LFYFFLEKKSNKFKLGFTTMLGKFYYTDCFYILKMFLKKINFFSLF